MKVIMSHPTGNANVRAAAGSLRETEILAGFTTAIATFPGDVLDRLSRLRPFAEFRRRAFHSALRSSTQLWPWRELGRMAALKAGLQELVRHETGPFSVDAVYHSIDRKVASGLRKGARNGVKAVYAYEDGAEASFREARQLGLQCLYDLPIGYWRTARRLLEAERLAWPEWQSTLTGFRDSDAKLARKDEELKLADHIFVASRFTAGTLRDFPGNLAPVHVIPYGFPPVGPARSYGTGQGGRPLKVLFVGGLTQRKGIANLFAAAETFGAHIELTVVGQKTGAECAALDQALSKVKWYPSLSHAHVLKLMREQDVLVFPSLFEGFGLVITEAMSQGTPVITTDRTAGPDLIGHGENGWIIKAGSTEAIRIILDELCLHPKLIAETGKNAMETARARPWSIYGTELALAIKNII
ncbi:glycosyltransferase family 4 protein [Larkinella soli]|uniref:glycosyltransferase family 4 protein n=1 Tax=Larkinella soli TaxID=1770527 RepID=UPI000FFC751E|nr:glycosyltransferase family 4 protein [Larkinella soli]